ncbi:methyltransferase domain-containing protein [Enterococcus sp. DIV0660C]|uniref:class I SAM-dependent methyltransferase n=1 Tax=Enterococcus sp. DIV0660C TaxID=2230880 RepID=UPI001A90739C|nr:methyltransferase domain-containing protein [Enterococcus sp. DIV0660C]MBO0432859.1 methyltransferase domain-containing protein [Enterococcus sp. DIV0660C]
MSENVFNQMANHYDTPDRLALAEIIRAEIRQNFPKETSQKVFIDYGGGTGLVSLPLANLFKETWIMDASEAMLTVTNQKINHSHLRDVHTQLADLTNDLPNQKADLLLVSLVLLHIPDTKLILKKLADLLNPGGQLFIVDFNKNEAVNHPKVHNGFKHEELKQSLAEAGLTPIKLETFHEGKNLFMKQSASLFLAISQK